MKGVYTRTVSRSLREVPTPKEAARPLGARVTQRPEKAGKKNTPDIDIEGNSNAIVPQRPRECTPRSSPACDARVAGGRAHWGAPSQGTRWLERRGGPLRG